MEILFLTNVLPERRSTGGEIGSHAFIDALRAAGHRVTVVGFRRSGDPPPSDPDAIEAGERPIETDSAPHRFPAAWMASALIRGLPYSAAKFRSRGYERTVRELLASRRFSLTLVDHAQMAWTLPEVRRAGLPLVSSSQNVEQRLYTQRAAQASGLRHLAYRRESRRMKQLEDRVARAAAAVWTVSADDTAYFASLDGTLARTFALPSPVVPVKDGRVAKQRAVGMIGSWTWDLSREALRWFVERVVPLLPPELDVEVAGRGADWLSSHAPRVRYIGFAPDAGRFMASSRVVAIPAIGTTGVQVKTLDAIASGSRIVASPPAVRELDSPPASVRVAGSAEEFAHAVAELATSSGSLEPDLDAIEWTRARRVRFESDVAEAVASVAVAR